MSALPQDVAHFADQPLPNCLLLRKARRRRTLSRLIGAFRFSFIIVLLLLVVLDNALLLTDD
jgi:hypothetical protein